MTVKRKGGGGGGRWGEREGKKHIVMHASCFLVLSIVFMCLMGGGSVIWTKAHWFIQVLVSQDSKLKMCTRRWSVPSVSIHLMEKNNPQKYIFHFWLDTYQKLDSILSS